MSEPTRKRRFPRKRFWIPLLLLVVCWFGQPMLRTYELRSAARGADRVRIVLFTPGSPELTQRVVDVYGQGKVGEFLDQITLRPSLLSCRCMGMTEVQLVRGEEPLVRLNYSGEKLIWMSGKWHSDGWPTARACARIDNWISENGGAELAKVRAEVAKLWAEWRAKRDAEDGGSAPASAPASQPTGKGA